MNRSSFDGYHLDIYDFATGISSPVATDVSFYPTWSPDGRWLAFDDNHNGVVLFDTSTGKSHLISPLPSNNQHDNWPTWSPDGTHIAFIANFSLMVMRPDGSDRRHLADLGSANFLPSWSPDGTRIVFHADSGSGYDIYTVRPDGTGLTDLTAGRTHGENPIWSPNGAWIAFTGVANEPDVVSLVRPDGSGLHQVGTAGKGYLAWSPDGTRLSYNASDGMHVADAATGADRFVVPNFGNGIWAPDGSFLVGSGTCGGSAGNLCSVAGTGGAPTLLVDYAGSGLPAFAPR